MITFTVDSTAVRKKLQNASSKLRKHVAKKLRSSTAPAVKQKFKQYAPKKTGALSRSGRTQVFEKNMTMRFSAGEGLYGPAGFPYPQWVAGIIPTIRVRGTSKFYAAGQTLKYGSGGVSPSGNPIRWTSTSLWWDGVQSYARRKVPQDVNQAVKEFTGDMNK